MQNLTFQKVCELVLVNNVNFDRFHFSPLMHIAIINTVLGTHQLVWLQLSVIAMDSSTGSGV